MSIALQVLSVVLSGPLDRLRGHPTHIFGVRAADKVAYAIALVGASGLYHDPLVFGLLVVAMFLGMSPGWGEPMGAILDNRPMRPDVLEWWQIGTLKKNANLALVGRGVLWGLPVLPIAYFDLNVLVFIPAFAIAMPLAMQARHIGWLGRDVWGRVEFARGWIAGLILMLTSFVV